MSVANKLTGKTLSNRYEVLRPLGEGGTGKVYLARDKRFGKHVLKMKQLLLLKEKNQASMENHNNFSFLVNG